MLGDLRVLDLGEELLLDTERVALQALFDMIRRFKIGYDVELHKRTVERALLSLSGLLGRRTRGPRLAGAASTLEPATPSTPTPRSRSMASRRSSYAPIPAWMSSATPPTRERLCARRCCERGAAPVGEAAAEIVRVERGRPRYGIDLDDTVIPQEAGLNERAVSFTKGCYVGQETVARLYYRGKPNRHLRGLRLSAPAEPGAELRLGERVVGQLTSAVLSPAHGPIGLALVRREAEPGATVSVGEHGAEAEVVELPFCGPVSPPRARPRIGLPAYPGPDHRGGPNHRGNRSATSLRGSRRAR